MDLMKKRKPARKVQRFIELYGGDGTIRVSPYTTDIVNDGMIATIYGVAYDIQTGNRNGSNISRIEEPLGISTMFDDPGRIGAIRAAADSRLQKRIRWLTDRGFEVRST